MITSRTRFLAVRITALLLATLTFAACGGDVTSTHPQSGNQQSGNQPSESPRATQPATGTKAAPKQSSNSPSGFASKVKLKGSNACSIKPMPDGAKLVDAAEKELARYTIKDGLRVKAKGPDDQELGQIKGNAAKIHVEKPGNVRTFALQRQADGDYKLEKASGELLNKIKKRDYGWKIEDASGKEIAKVKTKSGKTSLRDASDTTILSTKATIKPLAMACLGLEQIERPLRVALAIRIQAEGN